MDPNLMRMVESAMTGGAGPQPQAEPAPQAMQPQPTASPAQGGAGQSGQPGPSTPPSQRESEVPTATEQAIAATAPREGSQSDSILYEIDFGDSKRQLTPAQIKATYERYGALNHDHAQMKPILEVAKAIMEKTGADPMAIASGLVALAKGDQHNQPMGSQAQPPPTDRAVRRVEESAHDGTDHFEKWESENAASLPPGYREMTQAMMKLPQLLAQLQSAVVSANGGAQGTADAAKSATADASKAHSEAIRMGILNNLNSAQAALKLPNEAAGDFQSFAAERGYTIEDFADPQLTQRVMSDFAAVRETPEMSRLREIAQRRQAYTGSLGSTPSSGAPAAAPPQSSPMDSMIDTAMSRYQQYS
jgi:hypothetical protein